MSTGDSGAAIMTGRYNVCSGTNKSEMLGKNTTAKDGHFARAVS